jgi:hypothetical protein
MKNNLIIREAKYQDETNRFSSSQLMDKNLLQIVFYIGCYGFQKVRRKIRSFGSGIAPMFDSLIYYHQQASHSTGVSRKSLKNAKKNKGCKNKMICQAAI